LLLIFIQTKHYAYKTLTATTKQTESKWLFNTKLPNVVVAWFNTHQLISVASWCTETLVVLLRGIALVQVRGLEAIADWGYGNRLWWLAVT
jgi:hypothetical protein